MVVIVDALYTNAVRRCAKQRKQLCRQAKFTMARGLPSFYSSSPFDRLVGRNCARKWGK
jgi:hypothetical protein